MGLDDFSLIKYSQFSSSISCAFVTWIFERNTASHRIRMPRVRVLRIASATVAFHRVSSAQRPRPIAASQNVLHGDSCPGNVLRSSKEVGPWTDNNNARIA